MPMPKWPPPGRCAPRGPPTPSSCAHPVHVPPPPPVQLPRADRNPSRPGARERGSVMAEGVDQLALAHRGAALDADLPGPLEQVLLGPVRVGRAPAALLAD